MGWKASLGLCKTGIHEAGERSGLPVMDAQHHCLGGKGKGQGGRDKADLGNTESEGIPDERVGFWGLETGG
jgi:hypothetical protein